MPFFFSNFPKSTFTIYLTKVRSHQCFVKSDIIIKALTIDWLDDKPIAIQEFIIVLVWTFVWMSNDTLLSSCDQLIRYSQSVSVQLVKHAFVLPHAGSGGILPFCTYKHQAKIANPLHPNWKFYWTTLNLATLTPNRYFCSYTLEWTRIIVEWILMSGCTRTALLNWWDANAIMDWRNNKCRKLTLKLQVFALSN